MPEPVFPQGPATPTPEGGVVSERYSPRYRALLREAIGQLFVNQASWDDLFLRIASLSEGKGEFEEAFLKDVKLKISALSKKNDFQDGCRIIESRAEQIAGEWLHRETSADIAIAVRANLKVADTEQVMLDYFEGKTTSEKFRNQFANSWAIKKVVAELERRGGNEENLAIELRKMLGDKWEPTLPVVESILPETTTTTVATPAPQPVSLAEAVVTPKQQPKTKKTKAVKALAQPPASEAETFVPPTEEPPAPPVEDPVDSLPEFPLRFEDAEVMQMPEFGEVRARAYDEVISNNNFAVRDVFIDKMKAEALAALRDVKNGRRHEFGAAVELVAKYLSNPDGSVNEKGANILFNGYIDAAIDEKVEALIRKANSNIGTLIEDDLPELVAARDDVQAHNPEFQGSHTPAEFTLAVINKEVLAKLLRRLEEEGNKRALNKLNEALGTPDTPPEPAPGVDAAALADFAAAFSDKAGTLPPAPAEPASPAPPAEPAATTKAPLDKPRKPRRTEPEPSDVERNALFEKITTRTIVADRIPRAGGSGILDLEVAIEESGRISSPDLVVLKPGDKDKAVTAQFIIETDFSRRDIKPGIYTLPFRVKSDERDGAVRKITLERPAEMFKRGDLVRPLSFDSKVGMYFLPNGDWFAMPLSAMKFVDSKTGFLVGTEGEFPFVAIDKSINPQEIGDRLPIERYHGFEHVCVGRVLSPEEFTYQMSMQSVFEHYYRTTTAGLGTINRNPYRLLPSPREQERMREVIRAESAENPLDVVVSSSGRVIRRGFDDFRDRLVDLERGGADKTLIGVLKKMVESAYAAFDGFENQSKNPGKKEDLKREDYWNAYIAFFRRINSSDVSKLFEVPDVRQRYFPSDFDGESAIEFYRMSGIATEVVPFTPDQAREDRPYIERAIHLDISHGSGFAARASAEGREGLTIYLDEDDKHVFSATHAAYWHLVDLGFLKDNKAAHDLLQFINEEDSYQGLYESREDCAQILKNHGRNIYSIGTEVIAAGRYDAFIEFFREVVPKIEKEILDEAPALRYKKQLLRDTLLRSLVTYDVREFFRQRVPTLADLGKKDGGVVAFDTFARNLENKRAQSEAAISDLEARGFVGQTRFGKTLFDPFGAVKNRGLAAFAAGYDCFVGYNAQNRSGVVNIAPFAEGAELAIPDNLYKTEDTGEPIGSVIKGGRYLVLNASSQQFKNFEQIVLGVVAAEGTTFEVPPGVTEYIAAEARGETAALFSRVIRKVSDGVARPVAPRPSYEAELKQVTVEVPAALEEAQRMFTEAINLVQVRQDLRFGAEGKQMRARVVAAYKRLVAEASGDNANLAAKARQEMVKDYTATIVRAQQVFGAPGRERALAKHKHFNRDMFLDQFYEMVVDDAGLRAYQEFMTQSERDKIKAAWMKHGREVWDRTSAA